MSIKKIRLHQFILIGILVFTISLLNSCKKQSETATTVATPPTIVPVAKLFQISGTKIMNIVNNQEFIAKGVNVNGPYWPWPRPTLPDVNLIADEWKFNLVRVNIWQDFSSWNSHNADLDAIVNAFTAKKIVVMLEEHEYTGVYPNTAQTAELANWWRGMANKYKNNEYVWFNIMNEPGRGDIAPGEWMNTHEAVIKAIRDAGAPNIIVLDEHGYGQANGFKNNLTSNSGILSFGQQLNAKYQNLLYSLHTYATWSYGEQRLAAYLDAAKNKNLALIIGEYGVGSDLGQEIASSVLKQCISKNIGRIAWAWAGTDWHDLTITGDGGGFTANNLPGGNPTNLSYTGNLIWKDNHGTLVLTDNVLNTPPNVQVLNADFELSAPPDGEPIGEGWINFSQSVFVDRTPANVKQGIVAAKVKGGKAGGCVLPIYLKPGKTYRITAWGKHNVNVTTPTNILVKHTNSYGGTEFNAGVLSFTENSFTQKTTTFTLPTSMAECSIVIYKGDVASDFWADEIVIVEM